MAMQQISTRGPPLMGYRQGPIMQHGLVTTNVVVDFEMLSLRARMRTRGAQVIAGDTSPSNHAVLSIEHGDALFLSANGAQRMMGVPRNVPSVVVFAAFNLMTEKDANDAKFMGFAQNTVRPLQGLGLDRPDLACVVHGMQATLNNGTETIEAGDVVVAVPPDVAEGVRQCGDPVQSRLPERMATTGLPGQRAVAVMRSMHGAYSVFFNKTTNSLPRAYADASETIVTAAVQADIVAGNADFTGLGAQPGGVAMRVARALKLIGRDGAAPSRPFLALQPLLYGEMEQYTLDMSRFLAQSIANPQAGQETNGDAAHDAGAVMRAAGEAANHAFAQLLQRLSASAVFQAYSAYAFGLSDAAAIRAHLEGMVVRAFAFEANRGPMLIVRLIVDHLEFVRSYYQTKVVGKAMAQSTPMSTLSVYVNPGVM